MLNYILLYLLIQPLDSMPKKFQQQVIDSTVQIGYGIALGDVNGDNKPDILLADKKQFVWYRNGDWKRFVMAENLTEFDNVCIAARDLDGDGNVEVAVGAQWNPGETSDSIRSGSVHYLIRPSDPTQKWRAVQLPHEPTVHRMRWVKSGTNPFLIVLPLHGRSNRNGNGAGVRVYAYEKPADPLKEWKRILVDSTMHLTHNFVEDEGKDETSLFIAGKEGVKFLPFNGKALSANQSVLKSDYPAGEIKVAKINGLEYFMATIEPMHGNEVVVYENGKRTLLTSSFNEGHAIGIADFNSSGAYQIVAGWRAPDADGNVGIKLFYKDITTSDKWSSVWLDENTMACEDLQILDMNGDGKPDIVASGRASGNLKIYWNKY